MPAPGLIIFDCDGVLVDSEGIKSDVVARSLAKLGITTTGAALIERFSGMPEREVYRALSLETSIDISAEYAAETHALKLAACASKGEALVIPGVHACLDAAHGLAVCVASSASHKMIEQVLRQTRLWERFAPNIFSAHEVKRGKPAPDLFLLAAERMAVAPGQCVVIEDSPAGIAAAKAAAMIPIGFAGGGHCRPDHAEKLYRAGAGKVFMDMASLGEYLFALHTSKGSHAMERADASLMLFSGNYTWSAATRGVIATSLWGGADLGEVYKVVAALKGRAGEGPAWFAEWSAMAEKVAALAAAAQANGHAATAAAASMRAANYYQTGERLLQPRTEESQKAYARAVALFKQGIADVPFLAIEAVEVPFEGKSLPGYFVKSRDAAAPLPTLVFFDGLDITKEMQYFRGVPELVKRGLAVLIIDIPGTGESIRFRGMPARYDTNVAGTAAVDYLMTRRDVDANRLAVMGVSLGGYYAPRAAAFEPRFKACVSWGAIWDYHATWKKRVEKAFQSSLSVPGEHIMWVLGVDNIEDALEKLEGFRLAGVAEKVACPYLLTHGERDAQIPMEDARALFDAIGAKDKTLKVFTFEEGGYEHCQGDNLTIGIAYIGDWLADRLETKRRA